MTKVIWGRFWDPLLAKDVDGILQRRMDEVIDGEYQFEVNQQRELITTPGAYVDNLLASQPPDQGTPQLRKLIKLAGRAVGGLGHYLVQQSVDDLLDLRRIVAPHEAGHLARLLKDIRRVDASFGVTGALAMYGAGIGC